MQQFPIPLFLDEIQNILVQIAGRVEWIDDNVAASSRLIEHAHTADRVIDRRLLDHRYHQNRHLQAARVAGPASGEHHHADPNAYRNPSCRKKKSPLCRM
ncbi:hypothetical protein DBV15_02485 [Temnothorax longispinosus]|uniref:Uncharacterized protein n=1 Tax=Temnothorax longispinosus TaxID=300112 RepID=A0A4S2KXB7_9HYME|nr:hypothetical protein DBV15_02485 [Temnothorax longispinosus]